MNITRKNKYKISYTRKNRGGGVIGKNLKSAVNLANSKYLLTYLFNAGNVHRILFKNARYIHFLDQEKIIQIYKNEKNVFGKFKYCGNKDGSAERCNIEIKDGYIYKTKKKRRSASFHPQKKQD